jgi:hypothetical protein
MTERIHWKGERRTFTGCIGETELFQIWGSGDGDRWMLMSSLPGTLGEHPEAPAPDTLKAEAEKWLERFVVSLGAIFPGEHCDECGFTAPWHDHDKNCSRSGHPKTPVTETTDGI